MSLIEKISEIGKKAKRASVKLRILNANKKKIAYECLEKNIKNKTKDILIANQIDIKNAIDKAERKAAKKKKEVEKENKKIESNI